STGRPGFSFCAWASCESPSNPPRPWGRAASSLSLTTTVCSSMWASRSCGSLDTHPPSFLHSRALSSANLAQWRDPALHLPNADKQSRTKFSAQEGRQYARTSTVALGCSALSSCTSSAHFHRTCICTGAGMHGRKRAPCRLALRCYRRGASKTDLGGSSRSCSYPTERPGRVQLHLGHHFWAKSESGYALRERPSRPLQGCRRVPSEHDSAGSAARPQCPACAAECWQERLL